MAINDTEAAGQSKYTGYVEGGDAYTRWRNWFSILTGKMSEQGLKQYAEARDIRMEEADCKRCEKQRDYLLQYSKFTSNSRHL